jgi:tRNA uracil 4-sulfurtransferase
VLEKLLVIRSGETVLKGQNRRVFEDKLVKSVRRVLKPLGCREFYKQHNRIYVPIKDQSEEALINALLTVFGIDLISVASKIEVDFELIKAVALKELQNAQSAHAVKTFKLQTKRTDKTFPLSSYEISRELGAHLLQNTSEMQVDVHNPDVTIYVEIKEHAYIFSDRIRGLGGLPSETNGKAMLLLSGGIDSPVAGWMTAKRGVEIKAVHFHSYPYTSRQAIDKVKNTCRNHVTLLRSDSLFSINLLPFQQEIAEKCSDDEGTILVRRMMTRLAESLALQHDCDALVTGECLGQVASQTIQSLRATNESSTLPVLAAHCDGQI